MFESLSGRLNDVFDRLKRRGALREADVEAALRDIRVALLEADVALPVVKDFISAIAPSGTRCCEASRPARWWSRSFTTIWSICWAGKRASSI
jgi:signal recognition particle GTPase